MDRELSCVHCGLCLNACPTYRVLGTEADSPRGRLYLMEAVGDGSQSLDAATTAFLDRCLGCLACESACPSGVAFGRRMQSFRPRLRPGLLTRVGRSAVLTLAERPGLLRFLGRAARVLDFMGLERLRSRVPGLGLMPGRERQNHGGFPSGADGGGGGRPNDGPRAAVLRGCVGDALTPSIGRAAVAVLVANGIESVAVAGQRCCGALFAHGGRLDRALELARLNVEAFEAVGVEYVVTTAAGCGAFIREYGDMLADQGEVAPAALRLSSKVRDISELLVDRGLRYPRPLPQPSEPVAYHDACHLLHARGIGLAPRLVIEAATGTPPMDLGENEICCGSAGSYNIDHPRLAWALGARKAELLRESLAATVCVGNVGCLLQLGRAARAAGLELRLFHPVELLAQAYHARGLGGEA
ncbi:MAG: (Fe-S)-binding protein [Candidatus Binatia bacterium]